jgi:hypothetical protein
MTCLSGAYGTSVGRNREWRAILENLHAMLNDSDEHRRSFTVTEGNGNGCQRRARYGSSGFPRHSKEAKPVSDHLSIAVLIVINAVICLYVATIARQIHHEVQENLLATKTAREAAVKILQKTNA